LGAHPAIAEEALFEYSDRTRGAMPMPMSEVQFWSSISSQYDDVVDAQLGKNVRRILREKLSNEYDLGNAVEMGCGSGYFTATLARAAKSLVATDIAPEMIDVARRVVDGSNIRYQVEDCQKTSFANDSFDTAFVALVLQFTDADTAIAEMHRILKPGGTLLIANLDVLALRPPLRLLLVLRTMYHAAVTYGRWMPRVRREQLLSEEQLREKLERAGFKVLSCDSLRDRSRAWNCPVVYCRAVKL
jgi:ABC-2 type transport system ATP-binding protein